jgi:FtsP/CotA-like multicopper oxidase with cupredoxin domain
MALCLVLYESNGVAAFDLPSIRGGALLVRFLAVLIACFVLQANAQASDPADAVCPRFAAGASVSNPPELRSHHGVLETTLTFKTAVDATGLARYCYISESGLQSPTLRVKPGDLLIIHFRNALEPVTDSANLPAAHMHPGHDPDGHDPDAPCRGGKMSASSTNVHFHGMNVPPTCHQDEVLHTAIPPGTTFDYRIRIPADESPGLYWYHPHLHGVTQGQIQGGASAALVVEGIQAYNTSLAGLPERILVIRDQPLPASRNPRPSTAPAFDLSVNYVPVTYPQYEPATIRVKPAERQFWRVVNAAGNTILDVQLVVRGVPQSVQVFSIDGVPIRGGPLTQDDLLLGPGARAEFVFTTPDDGATAQLIAKKWDTGPSGDNDPQRPLANITAASGVQESTLPAMPKQARKASHPAAAEPTVERRLYFTQSGFDDDDKPPGRGNDDDANTRFYILVDAYGKTLFDMNAPPTIVVHQGTVEDWIVTNTTFEDHVFHIHQLHFQVLEINGQPVSDAVIRDTINAPHKSRNAPPPSVKLRMDFRGANVVGTFMYHCHIVTHSEGGMMGAIQVLPPGQPTAVTLLIPARTVSLAQPITVTAKVAPAGKGGAVPAGTVQFEADGNLDGPPIPLAGGEAARTFTFHSSGIHSVGATYSGDPKHEASRAQQVSISARYP